MFRLGTYVGGLVLAVALALSLAAQETKGSEHAGMSMQDMMSHMHSMMGKTQQMMPMMQGNQMMGPMMQDMKMMGDNMSQMMDRMQAMRSDHELMQNPAMRQNLEQMQKHMSTMMQGYEGMQQNMEQMHKHMEMHKKK